MDLAFSFTLNVFVAMAHRKLVEVYSRMQFQRWEKKKCLVFTVTTVPTGFKIKKYCPVWPPKENNAQHRTMCTVLVSSDSTSALWHGQWMSNQCMSDARKTGTKINSVFFWHIWWGCFLTLAVQESCPLVQLGLGAQFQDVTTAHKHVRTRLCCVKKCLNCVAWGFSVCSHICSTVLNHNFKTYCLMTEGELVKSFESAPNSALLPLQRYLIYWRFCKRGVRFCSLSTKPAACNFLNVALASHEH